jgi:hypothetical protein
MPPSSDASRSREGKHRVVVVGGGFAALEAVLGIRRLAGARVQLDLVSAERELTYRPLAVVEPFGLGEAPKFDLAEIAADQDVALCIDAVRAVDAAGQVVQTGSGTALSYDSLVMAIGARPRRAVPGAFTYRGTPDGPELRWHLERLQAGEVRKTVFAMPAGVAWPLPLYEGREIVRPLDPWPHSEAGRFHRVVSLMLVALALFVVGVAAARNHDPAELAMLCGTLAVCLGVGGLLLRDLRTHPAGFPAPSPSHGLRFDSRERRGRAPMD